MNDCNNEEIKARIATDVRHIDGQSFCWDSRTDLTTNVELLPRVNEISVNNTESDTPSVTSNNGQVSITFSTNVNDERLPLRYILVDWDDGIVYGDDDDDEPLCIGDQPDINTGHHINHTYQNLTNIPLCRDVIDGDNTNDKCATIKVQIEDNWGFCNNSIVDHYSVTNSNFSQNTPGCRIVDPNNPTITGWKSATTIVRFPSAGGGMGSGDS